LICIRWLEQPSGREWKKKKTAPYPLFQELGWRLQNFDEVLGKSSGRLRDPLAQIEVAGAEFNRGF